MNVAVLGAGSWGTALGSVLVRNGCEVTIWARSASLVEQISSQHRNSHYLPEARLPSGLKATTKLNDAIQDADVVIYAVPSASMRDVLEQTRTVRTRTPILCHAVKGFDPKTSATMSDLLLEFYPDARERICVIAGPSHAEEVVAGLPTTIVTAAYTRQTAETVQDLFMNRVLRVYTNPDVKGAELGGALKNIIALGVGIADGLGFGDNAKAALMTRGLTEIARLGLKLGASVLTFAGLSGVGDLIVTCTSMHSRNYRTGRLLGEGYSLAEALESVGMAVEGVNTTRIAVELARKNQIEMPIAEALSEVLFDNKTPRTAVEDLMTRARIHEIEEVARDQISARWK